MFNIFILGLALGILTTWLMVAAILRCRFRFHKWSRWQIAADGKSQFRQCEQCGYYAAELFHNFIVRILKEDSAGSGDSVGTKDSPAS